MMSSIGLVPELAARWPRHQPLAVTPGRDNGHWYALADSMPPKAKR
jgi:hypothetical protein